MDLTPLRMISNKLLIPPELMDLGIAFMKKDNFNILKCLHILSAKILPRNYCILFSTLRKIMNNDIIGSKTVLSIIDKNAFISLELILALYYRDSGWIKHSLMKGITFFYESLESSEFNETKQILTNSTLALNLFTSGDSVDFESLAKNSVFPFHLKKLKCLKQAIHGNQFFLNTIWENLDLAGNSKIVWEISDIIHHEACKCWKSLHEVESSL